MPTIRVDSDVYGWLQSLATPFDDNPNSVLRRIAGLDDEGRSPFRDEPKSGGDVIKRSVPTGRHTGDSLNRQWNVSAKHALYHREGTFYQNLVRFPGDCSTRTGT